MQYTLLSIILLNLRAYKIHQMVDHKFFNILTLQFCFWKIKYIVYEFTFNIIHKRARIIYFINISQVRLINGRVSLNLTRCQKIVNICKNNLNKRSCCSLLAFNIVIKILLVLISLNTPATKLPNNGKDKLN